MKEIKIKDDFITLGQLLKLSNNISSGGEAKKFIHDTQILVNGLEEKRRGKKLIENDCVFIDGIGEFRIKKK